MSEEKKRPKPNLFNNPMIESAMKGFTEEQRRDYEKWGENMFSKSFIDNKPKDPEEEMKKAVIYIIEGLKSGLRPKDLSPKELDIMYGICGEKWYEKYGYKKSDVPPPPNVGSSIGSTPLPKNVDATTGKIMNRSTVSYSESTSDEWIEKVRLKALKKAKKKVEKRKAKKMGRNVKKM